MVAIRLFGAGLVVLAAASWLRDAGASLKSSTTVVIGAIAGRWSDLHRASFDAVDGFVRQHLSGLSLPTWLLDAPGWIVLGVAGLVLLALGLALRRGPRATVTSDNAPMQGPPSKAAPRTELRAALGACKGAFVGIALFSGVSNVLMLSGAFYMLEIYDRVLASRSVPTLVAISILAGVLFLGQGLIDLVRSRLLVRVGASLDETMSARVYDAVVRLPLKTGQRSDGLQPLRDLESIRGFLSGLGPTALFDMPWMPLYLLVIAAFHPLLGLTALGGILVLMALTVLTEVLTRAPTRAATVAGMTRNGFAEASRRNTEVLTAMGFAGRMQARWRTANQDYLGHQQRISDVAGGFGAISRVLRMMLQSAMLGLGAWLVIRQEASAGIIIAGSILATRALAPADLAIANWRGFVAARQGWQRLDQLLKLLPEAAEPMALPAPQNSIVVESASIAPPGSTRLVVQEASFALKAGQGLGVIGPSASGKSSLARILVGVWQPARGRVRLDGAGLDQWSPEALGRHVGYLPQDVGLFAGTVAENIARFDPGATSEAIIAAARAAGVHDLIVALPNGYDTEIGEHGAELSAGQQQRIALARALYGDPFLVMLDEPNSNLDAEGEAALTQAIQGVRARGGIVVVIAHRPSALAAVDLVLVMNQGRAQAFGPKDEVLSRMVRPSQPPTALRVATDAERARP